MKQIFLYAVLIISSLGWWTTCSSQDLVERLQGDSTTVVVDTTQTEVLSEIPLLDSLDLANSERRKPSRALWKSALVPGWGQAYNKHYIKSGLFAGGIGTGIFLISQNSRSYNKYNDEYIQRLQDPSYVGLYPDLSTFELRQKSLDYKGRRGLYTSLTLAAYGLNVLDAYASAFIINSNRSHVPAKAAYYSTILPGLGQIYNKQWWKVPIFYIGLGVASYFVIVNYDRFDSFRDAYINFDDPGYIRDAIVPATLDKLGILRVAEFYRTNLDLAALITAGVYVLNIVDATVFAHLHTFEVDGDLSWKVEPFMQPVLSERRDWAMAGGWRISYRF